MPDHKTTEDDHRQLIATLCQVNGVLICVLSACRDQVEKPITDAIFGATTLVDSALALASRPPSDGDARS